MYLITNVNLIQTKSKPYYSYILSMISYFMEQIICLNHNWIFKCHLCKQEFYDPVAIGIHFVNTHELMLKSELTQ